MDKLRVKFLSDKIGKEIAPPFYATAGAAGMDLCACLDEPVTVAPMERCLVPTGLAVEIPQGFAGLVYARSGLAIKNGIAMANGVGVIDADYRGELCCPVINLSGEPFTISGGDRIAQLVLTPVAVMEIETVDALSGTKRGEGGFGSTGVAGKSKDEGMK